MQGRSLLAEQREGGFVLDELAEHHLDGDWISGLDGMALVNLAHAPGADLTLDLVNAVEPRAGRNATRARLRIAPAHADPPGSSKPNEVTRGARSGWRRTTSNVTLSVSPRARVGAPSR